MATTGSDFAQTPDAAERAALPKLKTLYVTGPAGSPTDVASQQLVALFPDLDITMVGTVAGALAEARKDRSIVALLISPQVPQNDTLALIVSLRRDRVPMAIVPVVLESHRDFFASAVSAGADDVILLRGDTLVGGHETLNRIRQSPHVTGSSDRYRLRVLYAGQDDAVWALLQETPFVLSERAACTPDGACLIRTSASPDGRLRCDVVIVDDPAGTHPLQVLKSIREQASDLPVMVLAPVASGEIETAALDLGADDTLLKNATFRRRLTAALRRWYQRIEITGQHAALRAREQRLRQIVENLPEGLGVIADNGVIRAMNSIGVAMFGAGRPTDLVGRAFTDFIVESERSALLERLRKISGGEAGRLHLSIEGLDGTSRSVVLHGVPFARDTQASRGVLAVLQQQPEATENSTSPSQDTGALQARVAELERERQALEERTRQAESDAVVRTDADAALADTLVSERAAWDDARRGLESEIRTLEEERANLRAIQAASEADWAEARRAMEVRAEHSEAAVADLLKSLEEAQSRQVPQSAIDDLKRSLNERVDQHENDRKQHERDRKQHESDRKEWDATRQDLESRLDEGDRAREDLAKKLRAAEQGRHELEQRVEESDRNRQQVQERLNDAEQRIETASSELQELRAEVYQTRAQTDDETVQLSARLRQARRFEEVGTLASSMAPEVQRLLTEVAAETQALAERLDMNDSRRATTDAIAAHAAEARDLLRQLLAFSVRQAGSADPVELGDAMRQMEPVLRQLLGEQMPLQVKQVAPAIIGLTRSDVHQLVTALVIAARDVLPIGGGIDVDITRADLTDSESGGAGSGPRAVLTVTASGYGVHTPVLPPAVEVLARRCDAFVKPTRDGQRRAGLAIYFPLAAAQ